jgi:hypothetical protein
MLLAAWLLAALAATPLSAEEPQSPGTAPAATPVQQLRPVSAAALPSPCLEPTLDAMAAEEPSPWYTAWGVVGLRAIFAGPKTAPNGVIYHPNFSIDLNFNFWLWRSQGLYMFGDMRLWGERSEFGVTNARDGFLGTSKREFDLAGGAAWNYAGPWEARAFGYTNNNLNRGADQFAPTGFTDGFGLENRYYLSPEYAKLGQAGFDVARAAFLSVGYYPSKTMVGNDGEQFKPGMMLRAYLIYDLWDWPCYLFGDATYISERSFRPRLLTVDLGIAGRPFRRCRQCEFRLGVENTADLQVHNVQNLWYVAVRYVY